MICCHARIYRLNESSSIRASNGLVTSFPRSLRLISNKTKTFTSFDMVCWARPAPDRCCRKYFATETPSYWGFGSMESIHSYSKPLNDGSISYAVTMDWRRTSLLLQSGRPPPSDCAVSAESASTLRVSFFRLGIMRARTLLESRVQYRRLPQNIATWGLD
jgi:hypothetical protein